ncbi:hypothetical protein HK405_007700, partial [Cladochytrium tenue]
MPAAVCDGSLACEVVLAYVVPAVGCIVSLFLFFSPLPALLEAARAKDVSNVNMLSQALITANCLGWMLYGSRVKDYFVTLPNLVGWCVGTYSLFVAYPHAAVRQRDAALATLLAVSGGLYLCAAVASVSLEGDSGTQLLGYSTNAVLVCFYASPLAAFARVVQSRDSAALNLPLAVAS